MSLDKHIVPRPWSTLFRGVPHITKLWRNLIPLILGIFLFLMNNLAPLSATLHPRPGYVPPLMPRGEDSAQYLTWIEASKDAWAIPDYHAPWQTKPALHVPFFWLIAKLSTFARIPGVYAYLGVEVICYVLAFYALALLLSVLTSSVEQSVMAIALMACTVPMRTYALPPAFLFRGKEWALLHSGYGDSRLTGYSSVYLTWQP